MSANSLLEKALELPLNERAELAAALLRSLDGEPDDEVEAAWAAEIEKRIRDVRSGQAELEPWEAIRDRAEDRLRQR